MTDCCFLCHPFPNVLIEGIGLYSFVPNKGLFCDWIQVRSFLCPYENCWPGAFRHSPLLGNGLDKSPCRRPQSPALHDHPHPHMLPEGHSISEDRLFIPHEVSAVLRIAMNVQGEWKRKGGESPLLLGFTSIICCASCPYACARTGRFVALLYSLPMSNSIILHAE